MLFNLILSYLLSLSLCAYIYINTRSPWGAQISTLIWFCTNTWHLKVWMGPLYPIYLYLYLYLQLYYLYLSSIFISTFWNWIIQSFNFMSVSARAWHVLRGLRVRLHQEYTRRTTPRKWLNFIVYAPRPRSNCWGNPRCWTWKLHWPLPHISRVGWISWIKSSRVKGNHPSTFEGHTSSWGTTWTAASRAAMSWWRSWPTSASFRRSFTCYGAATTVARLPACRSSMRRSVAFTAENSGGHLSMSWTIYPFALGSTGAFSVFPVASRRSCDTWNRSTSCIDRWRCQRKGC